MTVHAFQAYILSWYKTHKRDYLPWRQTQDPYHILVSEVMLQQTQVTRVLQRYPGFLKKFPTLQHLAKAPLREVLQRWQGMGYNKRALYLKRAAAEIAHTYQGIVPCEEKELRKLPGIGPYTAGALICFSFNRPVAFLDTNIRKVYLHFFARRFIHKEKILDNEILEIARKALYKENSRLWHYALMDYGALILKREKDLLRKAKAYHKQSPFNGSSRYFRANIVRYILRYNKLQEKTIEAYLQKDPLFSPRFSVVALLKSLEKDELIERDVHGFYSIR